jgi:hypothetical protein
MNFTQGQVVLVVGKVFTEQQLRGTIETLKAQKFVPMYLFQHDEGQDLVGAGTALFLSIRNCLSEQTKQDLKTYWLKHFRTGNEQKVWEEMVSTLVEKRQRFAIDFYRKCVNGNLNYRERTKFAIDVLTQAIPIAAAKREQTLEFVA